MSRPTDDKREGQTAIEALPPVGSYLCESIETYAKYWLNAAREARDAERYGDALMYAEQAVNGWKNLAYGLAKQAHYYLNTQQHYAERSHEATPAGDLEECHRLLDKAEVSRRMSNDAGTTWRVYTLAERVKIVIGAVKMLEREAEDADRSTARTAEVERDAAVLADEPSLGTLAYTSRSSTRPTGAEAERERTEDAMTFQRWWDMQKIDDQAEMHMARFGWNAALLLAPRSAMGERVKCDYPRCGKAESRCGMCDYKGGRHG